MKDATGLEAEPLTVGKRTVSDPITTPPEPTLMGIPLMVVPGPPLLNMTPSTATNPPGSTVNTWPSEVMTAGVGVCRGIVLVPIRRDPEGFKEIDV